MFKYYVTVNAASLSSTDTLKVNINTLEAL